MASLYICIPGNVHIAHIRRIYEIHWWILEGGILLPRLYVVGFVSKNVSIAFFSLHRMIFFPQHPTYLFQEITFKDFVRHCIHSYSATAYSIFHKCRTKAVVYDNVPYYLNMTMTRLWEMISYQFPYMYHHTIHFKLRKPIYIKYSYIILQKYGLNNYYR